MRNNSGDNKKLGILILSALGVVYGDIGTSPLYAVRECFSEHTGILLNTDNLLGIISLVFWSLSILISIKYINYVMHASNRGEGGVLVLTALISRFVSKTSAKLANILILLGIFGAALMYADAVLTPAISVLSAVEGLSIVSPGLSGWIVPLTIIILVGLFSMQSHGTHRIGVVFGPVVLIWFTVIGLIAIPHIIESPKILTAINPYYAYNFFINNGLKGFLVLGSVFLAVTGGEALYADLGHFGRNPIRHGWFFVALPGLLLNYMGQGALLIKDPESISSPFFSSGS
jgi:KUP system potassium uptake protein